MERTPSILLFALGLWMVFSPPLSLQAEPTTGEQTFAFVDSEQRLGNAQTIKVAVADLDGDGDLDVFAANTGADLVWLNDGQGQFTASGQQLDDGSGNDVALVDVDGDGDLDAMVANSDYNRIWLNDGHAQFVNSGQIIDMGDGSTDAIGTGDLDGDGDSDTYFGNRAFSNYADQLWLNDGTGVFTDSGQRIGFETSNKVEVGDVDQDQDLDIVVATCGNFNEPNKLWLNDGAGTLTDSGQVLDQLCSAALGLRDLDGDGDLDLVLGNAGSDQGTFTIWTNDGSGQFSKTATLSDNQNHLDLALGDVDGDSDADLVFNGGAIWLNDGTGVFTQSTQTVAGAGALVLADLDSDSDLDLFLARSDGNQVWFNVVPTALPSPEEPSRYQFFLPLIQ